MAFIFRGTHLIDAHGNYFASIYQTLILSPKPYLEEEKKDQFKQFQYSHTAQSLNCKGCSEGQ